MELEIVLPLVGVVLGWALNEAAAYLRATREDRRAIGQALLSLLQLRNHISRASKIMLGAQDYFGDALTESQRRHLLDTHVNFAPEDLEPAINRISAFDPVVAFELQDFLRSTDALLKQTLAKTEKENRSLYGILVELLTDIHTKSIPHIDADIRRLAWRKGPITWWRVRNFLRKERSPLHLWGISAKAIRAMFEESDV
jgi:hypothetical protein